jgi:predicted 3-demethylubiquinone-9 3-methyltransferase (glyoxalase superfamily)
LTVNFTLSGTPFLALNGGPNPLSTFNAAISFQIDCHDQAEVDHYWEKLLEGGGSESKCGWLKDRFGVCWQVVPVQMKDFLGGEDREGAKRAMNAMMGMVKLDIGKLREAYEG